MENEPSNMQQALPPEQAAAKVAILAGCDRLAEAGITFVAVHFDGSGDEGVSEEIKCSRPSRITFTKKAKLRPPTSRIYRSVLRHWIPTATRMIVRLRRRNLEREKPQNHG